MRMRPSNKLDVYTPSRGKTRDIMTRSGPPSRGNPSSGVGPQSGESQQQSCVHGCFRVGVLPNHQSCELGMDQKWGVRPIDRPDASTPSRDKTRSRVTI